MNDDFAAVVIFFGLLYLGIGSMIGMAANYMDLRGLEFRQWVLWICMWPICIALICMVELFVMMIDLVKSFKKQEG